ncbi:MAG TPA: hypothetical protein DCP61_02970 [Treponema sp.]|nr:hypothetical protein [Treponema sp.]
MKKVFAFAIAALLFFVAPALYAAEYAGDIQVNAGYSYFTVIIDHGKDIKSDNLSLGIANHNLWKFTDIFSFGFMENVDFGGGLKEDSNSYLSIMMGPAAAFNFNYGISLNLSFAPVMGCAYVGIEEDSYFDWDGLGCEADIQVKFFADSRFSPVLGFSWIHFSSDKISFTLDDHSDEFYMDTSSDVFKVYAGVSVNF